MILRDNEPHLLATLVLSFSISLPIIFTTGVLCAYFFNKLLNKWEMLGILLIIIIAHFFCLHRTGKAMQIVKEEPKILNNKLSIILTVVFFVITSSLLFYGPDIINGIMNK